MPQNSAVERTETANSAVPPLTFSAFGAQQGEQVSFGRLAIAEGCPSL